MDTEWNSVGPKIKHLFIAKTGSKIRSKKTINCKMKIEQNQAIDLCR